MKKRMTSLFLALCLTVGLAPAMPARAAEDRTNAPAVSREPVLNFGQTISAGDMHMTVIKEDGSVWAWGYNEGGRLGTEEGAWIFNGERDSIPEVIAHPEPVRVPIDKPVVSVSAGDNHTSAITSDGELWNWGGHNQYGGLGREVEGNYIAPGKVMDHAKASANGNLHTAVLTDDGDLWLFGGNSNGQIGNGGGGDETFVGLRISYPCQRLPLKVLDNVKAVATGGNSTYAVRNDGSLWAWGDNEGGILGNGEGITFTWEEEAEANKLIGEYYTRTVKNAEGGNNFYIDPSGGLSGIRYSAGTREEPYYVQNTPIKIMDGVKQVCSEGIMTLILKEDGTLLCTSKTSRSAGWDPERKTSLYTFAPEVLPIDDVVKVATGDLAYAAIRSDGSLWTWGDNLYGKLGRGKTVYGKEPGEGEISYDEEKTPTKALDDVVDVSMGDGYIAALKSDGTLWMAGVNGLGQLGGATEEEQSYFFLQVMDGIALPGSSVKQEIEPIVLPHSALIDTAPIQPEGAPVWDTTAWGDRYMNIPAGTAYFNGNAYAFYQMENCTWDEAENYCLSVGGHLATITTQEEQDFIQGGIGGPSWIGGRRNPYGGWDWVTGESWGYQCWYPGQNDNYGGYEGALFNGGGWGDASDNATGMYGFICEWETAGRRLPAPPAPIYSVTFEIQQEARIDSVRKQVIQGQTYGYLPTPTMEGWNFVGWYDGPESSHLITPSTVVNLQQSIHLYAKWTPNSGGPSVPRLSYSFGNNWFDLKYPEKGYRIPLDRYQYIFGNTDFATQVYDKETEWGGSCGGFCGTSTMLYMQNVGIAPSQFRSGASLAGELKIGDRNNTLGMTLREWIETVQTSQSSAIIQSQAAKSAGDYNGLVQGVLNFRNNNTEPIIIWIWGPYGQGGHAVVGVGAWRKDERTDCITVYDPNWPNTDRYIDLYRDSQGQYCGWYYDLGSSQWGSAYGNGVIQYVRYSDYMNVWNSRGTQAAISGSLTVNSANASIYDYSGNLVATIRDGQVRSLRSDVFPVTDAPAGEGSGKDGVTLWVPCQYFSVVNEDDTTDHLEVRVEGADSSVSASTSSDRVLVYGGGQDGMVLVSGDGESYQMTFSDGKDETVLTGTTAEGTPSCLARIGGQLRSIGVHLGEGETLTINGKAGGEEDLQRTTVLDVVTSTASSAVSASFSDVPGDGVYVPAVKWAVDSHITNGTALGAFSPDRGCTRAEVVTFLWRAAGCPTPTVQVMPFADVKESDWFYQAVLWAAGSGLTLGTDETHFSPEASCSNGELLTLLWRLLGEPGRGSELAAYDSAETWAGGQGLLQGTAVQDAMDSPCLRRDVVLLLYRTLY